MQPQTNTFEYFEKALKEKLITNPNKKDIFNLHTHKNLNLLPKFRNSKAEETNVVFDVKNNTPDMPFLYDTPVQLPEDCTFHIRPEKICNFFVKTSYWYWSEYCGNGHRRRIDNYTITNEISKYANGKMTKNEPVSAEEVENRLYNYIKTHHELNLDYTEITGMYKNITNRVYLDYIEPQRSQAVPIRLNVPLTLKLTESGIYVSGICDRILYFPDAATIVKFQVVEKKTSNLCSEATKNELLTLAYINKKVNNCALPQNIQVVTAIRKIKTIETRCVIDQYPIFDEDYEFIENRMRLIVETIEFVRKNPDLKYLIFKDYSLKQK